MPLKIVRNDITKMEVDVIVNPTNPFLRPTGGADAAIHQAAGPELLKACSKIGRIAPGTAAVTEGFDLPCRYVLHTAGPLWEIGSEPEREILTSCYRSCMAEFQKLGCRSIAFPLIASGNLGFPKDQALFIAVEALRNHPITDSRDVYLVVFDDRSFQISREKYDDVAAYISRNYVQEHTVPRNSARFDAPFCQPDYMAAEESRAPCDAKTSSAPAPKMSASRRRPSFSLPKPFSLSGLDKRIQELDESFSEMLLRKIDESGMSDAECYKKAHIDRKLFSKIRSDAQYRPSKPTVLSFAIALELSLEETNEMLKKAGFALSKSSKFDIIIEYFIQNGVYDLYQINEALYAFDQLLLGA